MEQLDRRFSLQAQWSRDLRAYIFRKYLHKDKISVLEIGSGTGSVLGCLSDEFSARIGPVIGIDKDPAAAAFAKRRKKEWDICIGTGESLPFAGGHFDFVFCHYLLLWAEAPEWILLEMKRVTAAGGICAALAEPCYTEMTAAPDDLRQLALQQRESLAERGADLSAGKKLGDLFRMTGFRTVEYGKYGINPADTMFVQTEIGQMLRDTNRKSFIMDPEKTYHYTVPTYFAVAEKEEIE